MIPGVFFGEMVYASFCRLLGLKIEHMPSSSNRRSVSFYGFCSAASSHTVCIRKCWQSEQSRTFAAPLEHLALKALFVHRRYLSNSNKIDGNLNLGADLALGRHSVWVSVTNIFLYEHHITDLLLLTK